MPKSPKTVRMSDDLDAAAELRWKALGYRSFADYARSLIRYDCLVGGEDHAVTMPICNQALGEQDKIDVEIHQWVREGKKGRGVLLERMIERAIEGLSLTAGEVKRQIGKTFRGK